jgi:hypothetical protein
MEMQQMMEMLARMDTNMNSYQEKTEAHRKNNKEEIRTNQAKLPATMEADKEKQRQQHKTW